MKSPQDILSKRRVLDTKLKTPRGVCAARQLKPCGRVRALVAGTPRPRLTEDRTLETNTLPISRRSFPEDVCRRRAELRGAVRIRRSVLDFLLTEKPLDFSPIPDLPHRERPINIRSSSSRDGESAEFSAKVDSDGLAGEQLGSKRQRSKSSQAEAQRRYRERKKNKMAELEETVSKLRAKISALESGSARETSPVGSVGAQKSDSGDSSFGAAPLEHFSLDAMALSDTAAPEDVPFISLSEVLASRSANKANSKELGDCVALALEAGDALRRRVNGPSAGGSFRSFAEVELWFGSMQDAYNLTVEKLSAQLRLGVADEEIRETIGEVNTLFADARNSRPTLSAVTAL